jgi:hypothetical protein
MNDLGRRALAERERDFLIAELSSAVGLGGRLRSVGSDTERARTAVARSIRYSLAQLGRFHPMLAGHLERSIETGTYCRYVDDPVRAIIWST